MGCTDLCHYKLLTSIKSNLTYHQVNTTVIKIKTYDRLRPKRNKMTDGILNQIKISAGKDTISQHSIMHCVMVNIKSTIFREESLFNSMNSRSIPILLFR